MILPSASGLRRCVCLQTSVRLHTHTIKEYSGVSERVHAHTHQTYMLKNTQVVLSMRTHMHPTGSPLAQSLDTLGHSLMEILSTVLNLCFCTHLCSGTGR